ncbi:TolB family protein [Tenacibaculum sp. TC6]|uniref:TolB family protein n=1 Tax=Tenacibaculum sp. TC6 TaxID=3423223 RepID=UPI003D35EBEE
MIKKAIFLFFSIVINSYSQEAQLFLSETFEGLPNVRDFSMSNHKNEIYFTVESYRKEYSFIAFIKKENKEWSKPKVANFSGKFKDLEPFLSPDGLKLFFVSNRTQDSKSIKKDTDIWYVSRKTIDDEWSKPIRLDGVINTDADEFYPSVTNAGDLFFTAEYKDTKGKEDIYVSRFIDGKYTNPVSLDVAINSEKYEFNAYVSPNEDLIVFTSYGRKEDLGNGDLYISKKVNGKWLPAQHMGNKLNSKSIDYCPYVDTEKDILYFTSGRSEVPKHLDKKYTLDEILAKISLMPNGLSRIYTIPLNKN